MEDKEIAAGNTILHDWMGHRRMKSKGFEHCWIGSQKVDDLRYHRSWDWLMPACRKFKDLDIDHPLYASHMHEIDTQIIDEYSIVSAWFALVEGIKWYNSQSPTK